MGIEALFDELLKKKHWAKTNVPDLLMVGYEGEFGDYALYVSPALEGEAMYLRCAYTTTLTEEGKGRLLQVLLPLDREAPNPGSFAIQGEELLYHYTWLLPERYDPSTLAERLERLVDYMFSKCESYAALFKDIIEGTIEPSTASILIGPCEGEA